VLTIRAAVNACQRGVNAPVDRPEPRLTSENARARPNCQRVNAFPRPPPPTPPAPMLSTPAPPPKLAGSDPRRHILPTGHTGPTEISALRRSQRTTRTPTAQPAPQAGREASGPGTAPTVTLRLHGTPPANRAALAALAALATVLDIQSASRPYPDRPPSTKERARMAALPQRLGSRDDKEAE